MIPRRLFNGKNPIKKPLIRRNPIQSNALRNALHPPEKMEEPHAQLFKRNDTAKHTPSQKPQAILQNMNPPITKPIIPNTNPTSGVKKNKSTALHQKILPDISEELPDVLPHALPDVLPEVLPRELPEVLPRELPQILPKVLPQRKVSRMDEKITAFDEMSTHWYENTANKDTRNTLREYIGASYEYYNQYGRGLKIKLNRKEYRNNIIRKYKGLIAASNTFPPILDGITLYRGGDSFLMGVALKDMVDQIFRGKRNVSDLVTKQFSSPGFMSTTYKKSHAISFCNKVGTPILLTFHVQGGAKAISISRTIEGPVERKEGEILFPPNSCIMTITDALLVTTAGRPFLKVTADLRPNVPLQAARDDEDPFGDMPDDQV